MGLGILGTLGPWDLGMSKGLGMLCFWPDLLGPGNVYGPGTHVCVFVCVFQIVLRSVDCWPLLHWQVAAELWSHLPGTLEFRVCRAWIGKAS